VETEIALAKLKADLKARTEILQIAEHYNAKVVDYGPDSLVLRLYGVSAKLDAFFELMGQYDVVELMRSGKVLMARGLETT
jgi:acetolactate synthase-1/3 small subunit